MLLFLAVLSGLAAGCNDSDSGPVLTPGTFYGYILDSAGSLSGTVVFTADKSGQIELDIQGLKDKNQVSGPQPFAIHTTAKILLEGADFQVNGTAGPDAIVGYGRARVFTDQLLVSVPIDDIPMHALRVGGIDWQLQLQGPITADAVRGTWYAHSAIAGMTGVYYAARMDSPPRDADVDAEPDAGPADGPPDAPPPDAPADAGASDGGE